MSVQRIIVGDFKEVADICFTRWPDFRSWLNEGVLASFIESSPEYCLKYTTEDGGLTGLVLATEGTHINNYSSVHIRIIIVAEKYRRKGIGRQLLEAVEEVARNNRVQSIWLDSGERDYGTGAFLFYTDMKYKVVGHAKIHGDNLIFFEKELV